MLTMWRYLLLTLFGFSFESSDACCSPKQWSASIIDTVGEYNQGTDSASLAYVLRKYYYDGATDSIAYFEESSNTTFHAKTSTHVITNYQQGRRYIVLDNNCTVDVIKTQMPSACIPDNATHLGRHNYPAGVQVDMWFWEGKGEEGGRRLGVTVDTCLPLTEALLSTRSGRDFILRTSSYQNVTVGISDPTAFTIPTFCKTDA
ncbi:uncharacterized protein LOC127851591 [Dreissena polymorpha]|uniref:Uncharacterized protein n=1 Tax=Dreissena polymorpha TaxID=45954 RepID=A0A9D4N9M6_DREPO|nr:uncharacterized protein LOC127851591 [Dreissena polymorpha]KAH3890366.1 hypothetical protein DPMN_014445 [Dreissena polymorpha]